MAQTDLFQDATDGVDRAMLQRMLSLGGSDLRPVLITQLNDDLLRLRTALEQDDPTSLHRAAHELKGLCSTIGAEALADMAARFDSLSGGLSASARGAMALGLRLQIDRLLIVVQAEAGPAASK